MDRREAVAILTEILDECPSLDGDTISLIPSSAFGLLAKGYQIHITTRVSNDEVRKCLGKILQKYGLRHVEREGRLMIYRPHPASPLLDA